MKIAGIIAEYNPFHNGHALHIRRTREATGCDYVVACMAGHFTQRGEPAMFSKWARASMALSCGADAVFELPAMFAVRTADVFARGGVAILGGLGADALSFGSETDDMDFLRRLAALRAEEPAEVSEGIRRRLAAGMSHPRARGEALGEALGVAPEEINRPNLILAAEYLRAMGEIAPGMQACAILREGDYRDESLTEFASASAVRRAFASGRTDLGMAAIPRAARPYALPDAMHTMDDLLLMKLRDMSVDELRALPDMAEGLENRLARLARECSGREALLAALKCRRYTYARLSRVLTHALLGMTRAVTQAVPTPPYARLLGVRRGAEPLLAELKARTAIPLISNPRELDGDECFALECRATDLWALLHDAPELRRAGREYTEKFIRI